jgi:glycosyltransferase involved in cell wall biosynthesis
MYVVEVTVSGAIENAIDEEVADSAYSQDQTSQISVLFVSKNHLPHIGGAEISTHHLAYALASSGHRVHVVTQVRRRSALGVFDVVIGRITKRSLTHVDSSLGYRVVRSVTPLQVLRSVCCSLNPDAIVVTGTDPAFAVSVLERTADWPSILYLRGAHSVPFVVSGVHYDAVVANSPFIARAVRSLGVDAAFLPSVFPREVYRVTTTREKVLFVNPIPKKGVDIALYLAAKRPDIPFVFSLSWRMKRRALRRLRAKVRTFGNVEIRKATHEPAVLFRDARLIIVPTRWPEAWPRMASEGQISGIPVIGGNVGGIPDSVGPGGIIVDPAHSAPAWLEALAHIWDDEDHYRQLAQTAAQHSRRDELAVDGVVRRFEALVRNAIKEHSACS